MWGRLKTLVLAVVVGSAALVPLFGDPRTTPVTHPLWARMLLRSMEMTDAVRASARASQVFGALAWRDSLSYPADRFLRADGAVVKEENGQFVVTAAAGPAELVYPVAIVQPGDYQLRARLAGTPDNPASAELAPLEGGEAVKTFTLVPDPEAWAFGGSAHLDPGAYGASLLLPEGCSLSQVEVAPPCLNPIEPEGGWQPRGLTTAQDLATTALKALDMEHELPRADVPIEIRAADFQIESPPEAVEARGGGEETPEARSLRAGRRGLRAITALDIPAPGLYSVFGFVAPGAGQRWLVDGCRKAIVCPSEGRVGWRPILTQSFSAGRHTLLVSLGDTATLDLVRIERKKNTPDDYVATMRRLGFDPGPEGPVSRDTAISAMSFIRDKKQEAWTIMCGDNVLVADTPPPLPPPAAPQVADLPAPPLPTLPIPPITPLPPPIGPPILPPQAPASPTRPTGG